MIHIRIDPAQPRQRLRATLDGAEFEFRLYWIERCEGWYMDLATAAGVDIIVGRRISVGSWLLRGVVHAQRPAGALTVVDLSGDDAEPGPTDLGDRVRLMYLTADEARGFAA